MIRNYYIIEQKINSIELTDKSEIIIDYEITFPKKYFNKKSYAQIIPVFVTDNGDSIVGKQLLLRGEKTEDDSFVEIISYANPTKINYIDTITYKIDYEPNFLKYNSNITINRKNIYKTLNSNEFKIYFYEK